MSKSINVRNCDDYDLVRLMKVFDESEFETKPTFMMIRQYMHMVELRACFKENSSLHISSAKFINDHFYPKNFNLSSRISE